MESTLQRSLGVPGIVFMVVAAAAPITVVVANFPIVISESGSIGAPLMVLAATLILALFSVGYAWMTPKVPDAGAFYSYVDRGLGRRAGLGTAAIARPVLLRAPDRLYDVLSGRSNGKPHQPMAWRSDPLVVDLRAHDRDRGLAGLSAYRAFG